MAWTKARAQDRVPYGVIELTVKRFRRIDINRNRLEMSRYRPFQYMTPDWNCETGKIHPNGKTVVCNGPFDSRNCHCASTVDQSLMIQRTEGLRLS